MTEPTTPSSSAHSTTSTTPAEVLDFWLGDGVQNEWPTQDLGKRWFGGGADLDAEIRARFGAAVQQAVAGGLREWEQAPLTRLALVILLDQFTRNVFRGKSQAFAGDARAQQLVQQTIQAGEDLQLPWAGRVFLYMPLMHAESLALQDECVASFARLVADAPESLKPPAGQPRLRPQAPGHRRALRAFSLSQCGAGAHRYARRKADFLLKGPRFGQ
jgi:uncharacterized protein (DUF924 family)